MVRRALRPTLPRHTMVGLTLLAGLVVGACGDDGAAGPTTTATSTSTTTTPSTTTTASSTTTTSEPAPVGTEELVLDLGNGEYRTRTPLLSIDLEEAAERVGQVLLDRGETYVAGATASWEVPGDDGAIAIVSITVLRFEDTDTPSRYFTDKSDALAEDASVEIIDGAVEGATVWQARESSGFRGGAAIATRGELYMEVAVDGDESDDVRRRILEVAGRQLATLGGQG